MPKKKNIKKILIISILLLIVILAVRQLVVDVIERNSIEEKEYNSISDFSSIEEIAKYTGCTYIKEEKSTGEKYDIDIYLKFKYPLYTDEVSNKDYYYKMIAMFLEYVNYQNIRLIDEENNIVIAVECNKENKEINTLLINGEENYFGKVDTKNILENYETIKETTLEVQSPILSKLIENDWEEKNMNFGTQESVCNNYKIYFDEGIEIKIAGKKVFHLVFTEKYSENIVNGIKSTTDEETIKKILGEPEFKSNRPRTIGYKGKEFYIFFNTDYKTVSIYRIQNTTEKEKETIKRILAQLSIDGNTMSALSSFTDMWSDYDSLEYSDNYILLQYTLRGMKFEINVTENNGLSLYGNYTGTLVRDLKNGEQIPYIYMVNTDLIYLYELKYGADKWYYRNAINELVDEQEKTGITPAGLGSNKYIIINTSTDTSYKQLRVISLDNQNYNFDFDTKVDSYLWLNDDNFAYSIKNKGIYRYNITTKETQIILEGMDEFNLVEYKNSYLKYDDKEIIYIVE